MKITYSIVAPIYNELENLPELYLRIREVMDSTGETWELVLVDDGSSDGSTEAICELGKEDKRVRPVIFARNFGHQVEVTAGLDYSRGDAVIIRNGDGVEIGRGLTAYDHEEAKAIIGRKSGEIAEILGYLGRPELIHRDDMVLQRKM